MNAQICAACFHLAPADARTCPACGADLATQSARDYRDKLLTALHHPLADVRMRAIIALGWRGEAASAEPLARCALRHPTDVVEGLEVVDSLARIRDAGAARRALHALQAQHPAHAVRVAAGAAEQALGKACDA